MRHEDETSRPSGERDTQTHNEPGGVVLLIKSAVAYGLILANAVLVSVYVLTFLKRRPLADRLVAQCAFAVCNLRCEVIGTELLPEPPYVILSMHQSSYEAMVFPCLLPPFAWVLKQSLVRVPVLGSTLGYFAPIAIDRSQPRQALKQVFAQGLDRLRTGTSVLVFPEGTRFPPGKPGRYHASGAALAQRADVSIVPIAHDTGVYWGAYSFPIRPGTVVVRISAPISPQDMQGKSAAEVAAIAGARNAAVNVALPKASDE